MIFNIPAKKKSLGKLVYDIHHKTVDIKNITPLCLQLLHVVAHINLLQEKIIPAINKGKTVLLDRYWWSTIVYSKASNVDDELISCAIDIECKFTDMITHKIFFYITRNNREHDFDKLKENTILKEYSRLFNECRDRKYEILNEGPIEKIVDLIFDNIFNNNM